MKLCLPSGYGNGNGNGNFFFRFLLVVINSLILAAYDITGSVGLWRCLGMLRVAIRSA
jgi:hypothetical protein